MSTQHDVARLASVSIATVSRYINNVGYISPEVKKRIKSAIAELKYRPNLIARSLKIKTSGIIGLVFPDIDNQFFIDLIKSAEECAQSYGYNVILCNTQNSLEKEKTYLEALRGKMADGYIIIPVVSDNSHLYDLFRDEKVVFVDRSGSMENEISVLLDNRLGIKLAVEYLLSLGHKKIGVINVPGEMTTGYERYEGFKEVMNNHALRVDERLVKFATFTVDSAYAKTKELLTADFIPTALLPMSGLTTIGALKAIRETGLSIPRDISIIGFDEFEYASLFNPPITTVAQPAREFGVEAIKLLWKIMTDKKVTKRKIVLEPELLIRESCAKIR